jgi:hypothetical protein
MKRFLLVAISAVAFASVGPKSVAQSQLPVLIFAGEGHREFAGCLTCSELDANSVWNDMSSHGWRNGFGTWNPFGPYKNPFGPYSACNEFASDPPVLVDRTGQFYGRLSVNAYAAASVCAANGNSRICAALKVMCTGT